MRCNTIVTALLLTMFASATNAQMFPGLRIQGRHLLTPCGDTLLIRGVNKMSVWVNDLELRKQTYAEIKKTGANCVRIVWVAQPGQFDTDAGTDGLDRNIQDAINAGLIPMIELHDATGDWSKLGTVVDHWVKPEVVAVIKKHERYLLVNIANEAGDETVTDQMFVQGYTSAVQRMREAGISTPLVIDAADWGKNLEQLVRTWTSIRDVDPMRNVMFSVHTYWAVSDGATDAFITSQLTSATQAGMPFIVGEFTHMFNRDGGCTYETDYQSIVRRCQELGIGWLAWEWGPGNEFADPSCLVMNMTTDSKYATLKDTWAKVVVETSPYAIRATSRSPYFVMQKGACQPTSVADEIATLPLTVIPNPSDALPSLRYDAQVGAIVRLDITDAFGSVVLRTQWNHDTQGPAHVALPIDRPGSYYGRLVADGRARTFSFVIVR